VQNCLTADKDINNESNHLRLFHLAGIVNSSGIENLTKPPVKTLCKTVDFFNKTVDIKSEKAPDIRLKAQI